MQIYNFDAISCKGSCNIQAVFWLCYHSKYFYTRLLWFCRWKITSADLKGNNAFSETASPLISWIRNIRKLWRERIWYFFCCFLSQNKFWKPEYSSVNNSVINTEHFTKSDQFLPNSFSDRYNSHDKETLHSWNKPIFVHVAGCSSKSQKKNQTITKDIQDHQTALLKRVTREHKTAMKISNYTCKNTYTD